MVVVGTARRLDTMALSVIVVLMHLRLGCCWSLQNTGADEDRDIIGSSHKGGGRDGDKPVHLGHAEPCKDNSGGDVRDGGAYGPEKRNAHRVEYNRRHDKLYTQNET